MTSGLFWDIQLKSPTFIFSFSKTLQNFKTFQKLFNGKLIGWHLGCFGSSRTWSPGPTCSHTSLLFIAGSKYFPTRLNTTHRILDLNNDELFKHFTRDLHNSMQLYLILHTFIKLYSDTRGLAIWFYLDSVQDLRRQKWEFIAPVTEQRLIALKRKKIVLNGYFAKTLTRFYLWMHCPAWSNSRFQIWFQKELRKMITSLEFINILFVHIVHIDQWSLF